MNHKNKFLNLESKMKACVRVEKHHLTISDPINYQYLSKDIARGCKENANHDTN